MGLSNTATPKFYAEFREAVLNGEIPVNEWVSLEMNRIDFLISSPDYYYDEQAIDGYVNFCNNELTIVNGDPLDLLDTFKLWAEQLYGWYVFNEEQVYNPVTRRNEWTTVKKRLTVKQYLIVGRGASKTMYASTVQAYGLVVDPSTTTGIVTAPTMRQADETLQPIRTALQRSRGPLFQFMTQGTVMSSSWNKVGIASTKLGIQNFVTNSIIEIRPMTIDKLQGARSKYNTVDEWLSGNVRENVIGALEQGAAKGGEEYLILATSSEGTVRDGIGDSIKLELKAILRGEVFAPHISIWYYCLDDISEVGIPEMWLKANPNLGATVSYDTYQKDVVKAENFPAERNDILAKRFGIPVEGSTYYFTYEETLLHPKRNYDGMLCAMGADLSQGDDFTAFTFLFPLGQERYGVKTRSYVARNKVLNLPRATQQKYEQLEAEGSLIVMEGSLLDMEVIFEDLNQFIVDHDYGVAALGYDRYNSEVFLKHWIANYGEYGVTKVIQGARTESVPLGEIKALARERDLYFDQELMKFAMGNSIVIQDNNGNQKLDKRRQEEKIDNVAALMDAWVAYTRFKEAFDV